MNGTGFGYGGDPKDVQIVKALEAVHDPRSTNTLRQDGSKYLESIRANDEAPYLGFGLASSKEQSPIVRHYGLSLIDWAVRYRWSQYTPEQSKALRSWILQLAHGITELDPPFITNKIGEIWVELAKRSWALDWMDMDELLVQLWHGTLAQKLVVLAILEMLSEDFISTDDPITALRGDELHKAYIDIFTPSSVISEQFPHRDKQSSLRHGDEGWILRLTDMLASIVHGETIDKAQRPIALKLLSTLKSVVAWSYATAIVATRFLPRVCSCLAVNDLTVQLAAMEALYTLYHRSKFTDHDFQILVGPMFQSDTISLLGQLYKWLLVDPNEIEDAKYLLLKRFSEMLYNIGTLLAERPSSLPDGSDLGAFLSLLLDVIKSPSLQVSIPALHLWCKILNIEKLSKSSAVASLIGDLLETCSQRLVRYEALPSDSTNPSILFLKEDIETVPERHAFLGNYARFCEQIVESVVQQQPTDALYHILGQADQVLDHVYDGEPVFQPATYSKNSIPYLKVDAQFTVIEAALKGWLRYISSPLTPTIEREQEIMASNLQVWCDRLLGLIFEDPIIKERVIQLAVGFAVGPLRRDSRFAVRVFDKILEARCPEHPDCVAYTEAVRSMQIFCIYQLQRLAIRFANHLVTIYDELEQKLVAVSQSVGADQQMRAHYSSILFVIMHRAVNIDPSVREMRMESMVLPILEQWQDSGLVNALSSASAFGKMLGLDGLQHYISSRQAQKLEDWASYPLDEEGKVLQSRIKTACDSLPLHATKRMMGASVDKLEKGTQPYDMACRLWHSKIKLILPNLLQLISLSQTVQDPVNWPGMTPEMEPVVRRIFTDRFWQVGISQGSRDDFYAKIGGTRSTMEGIASSTRSTMRTIRETGYRLLLYMSGLGDFLYSFPELPGPLARALFADAVVLSPHQMSILVDMMRPIIEGCPPLHRDHFLPPVLAALFQQVDNKASLEWARIEARNRAAGEDDDLVKEMKDESILRQLTMASVRLVDSLLESPDTTESKSPTSNGASELPAKTRSFVLRNPEILKPLILFCTHALRMRDTRACTIIAKVLRDLIPEYAGESAIDTDVREFISTEVLMACVESLNDPYFVEMQKEFAQLIAIILIRFHAHTSTPEKILLSLPGMTEEQVGRAIRHLDRAHANPRQQRGIVLQLLEGFRGVTIHEQGKLPRPDSRKVKSAMQQRYLTQDMETTRVKDESPELAGVAEMFG